MCMWSTPKADGWEDALAEHTTTPRWGSRGRWPAFRVQLSINTQELSGTKFHPCHGKTDDSVTFRQGRSRERKSTKRTRTGCNIYRGMLDWVSQPRAQRVLQWETEGTPESRNS